MKVFVLNDTASHSHSRHNHAGSNATMHELYSMLDGHDIVGKYYAGAKHVPESIKECDAVICNGEGTMRSNSWRVRLLMNALLEAQQRGQRTALVNSVWHKNADYSDILDNLDLLTFREVLSYEAAGGKGHVYPDLVFGGSFSSRGKTDRQDIWKGIDVHGWLKELPYPCMPVEGDFQRCMDRMADCGFYITGQYHGVVLAIMTNTPFAYVPGNTPKIEGLILTALMAQPSGELLESLRSYYGNATTLQQSGRIQRLLQ